MEKIIENIRVDLIANSDEKTKASSQRFFKEEIVTYGVSMPKVSKIAKEYHPQLKSLSKSEVFELCETLWQSGVLEESFVACHWSYLVRKKYELSDFQTFEHWIENYISNWASCDTFCNHTIGEFVEKYPQTMSKLLEITKSPNRWMRRAAAVSLIVPARKGLFKEEIFEIAHILLLDSDDLVQKGYGWMLKVCSQVYQQEVFEFVMNHKKEMPRTALRYAIEKMPKELKIKAMEK